MKAIELPINVMVIIVIAVIVLLAIVALFFGAWNPIGKSISLVAATKAVCQKINPTFCNANSDSSMPHANGYAARMPVDDFDANKNGTLNDRHPNPPWATSYKDDNLEMLCDNYYGCGPSSLMTESDWATWDNCCLVKVCGC